jgi:predicted Mrr-cat superfamily restriction endonuclease
MEEQDTQVATEAGVNAFVLRIAPGEVDRVAEALRDGDLMIGWSMATGLLDPQLSNWDFRESVHQAYYAHASSYRTSGSAAGSLRRFIRDMKPGDLVVTPHWNKFYIGRVEGPARYEADKVDDDTAYRRRVSWLNEGKPFPRVVARAALQSRMKIWHTCGEASDLLDEINEVLKLDGSKNSPRFEDDLRAILVERTLNEMRNGRMESFGFEHLVAKVLRSLGGTDVVVRSRRLDKGADILARFTTASTFEELLAVQAKHFQPEPPVPASTVDQLVEGMEAEEATLGWVVTSGTFSKAAEERRQQLAEEKGLRIELVDGEQLAAMVVEGGLRNVMRSTDQAKH